MHTSSFALRLTICTTFRIPDDEHFNSLDDHVPYASGLGSPLGARQALAKVRVLNLAVVVVKNNTLVHVPHLYIPMRTIRGVPSLARSLAQCNYGWVASSTVQTRKVAFCLAGSISSCAMPIAANRGTPFTSRRSSIPLSRAWNNIRFCSSHASSSLVKMATDRDILSDEYVS